MHSVATENDGHRPAHSCPRGHTVEAQTTANACVVTLDGTQPDTFRFLRLTPWLIAVC